MPRRLLLMRHASVAAGLQGRLVGSSDVPLDAAGRAQAQTAASRIARAAPQVCVCSPLERCRETAALAAPALTPCLDADLREIDFGQWEKRTFAEVAAAQPEIVDRWAALDPTFAFPGGESVGGFLGRTAAAAGRLAAIEADSVLVVAHGGTIRALVCHWLGLQPRQYVLFDVRYTGIVTVELFGDRGVLVFDSPDQEPGGGRDG